MSEVIITLRMETQPTDDGPVADPSDLLDHVKSVLNDRVAEADLIESSVVTDE